MTGYNTAIIALSFLDLLLERTESYVCTQTDITVVSRKRAHGRCMHLTLGSDRGMGRHSRYQYSVILSAQSGAYCA